ncbi:hypothetical protein SAMN03159341_104153 [Paenibacillus sp. 1_12]|uniref:hypothetical protein n=1 Tax=Paenibacillus sp. 1_12 TaxID=1566278 RepID=UPI0008EE2E28|nr:hypothetical protein [Paenibacillus sp. 1_12]SFL23257.1 hypothetical protein SAMN03159341_104153 [Paenibacillus sp. 1_12]
MMIETSVLIEIKLENEEKALLIQTMKEEQVRLSIHLAQLDELLLQLEKKLNRFDHSTDFTSIIEASA